MNRGGKSVNILPFPRSAFPSRGLGGPEVGQTLAKECARRSARLLDRQVLGMTARCGARPGAP